MAKSKIKYVCDERGKKIAVILDIASYRTLLKHLEDLEDALSLDEAVRSTKSFRSYDEVRADLVEFKFVGSGKSGRSDISVRHDEALGEDFK